MKHSTLARNRRRRGGVLITVLAISVVIACILAGMGTFTVAHYSRATTEANYSAAIGVAEGGINYELRKISQNAANADQISVANPQGVTYTFGGGNFRVYCTNRDGSTPWTPPNKLYIVSVGNYNGLSRTIKIAAKGAYNPGNGSYAVFGILGGTNNGTSTINGNVGTDGTLLFHGQPTVNGDVVFNGANSGWQSPPNATYTVFNYPTPVPWWTVDQIANQQFPSGGLAWLATHNDNALASPPITNNQISLHGNGMVTLVGKPGGANYYLTDLLLAGNAKMEFDNTNGPITVWEGPSGSSTDFSFQGGTASIKMSQDPTKPVKMYVATTNDITLGGNDELDAGIYNVNGANSGQVIFNGNPTLFGSVITNTFTIDGNPTINFVPGFFLPSSPDFYAFDNYWAEINGM